MPLFPKTHRAAVSLTYDDGLPSHLSTVGLVLAKYHLRGTFFLSDRNGLIRAHPEPWMAMRRQGHEYAAHTLCHPCPGGLRWDPPGQEISQFSLPQMEDDLKDNVALLRQLGEDRPHLTFAYPCGATQLGPDHESYVPLIRKRFAGARGVVSGLATESQVDFHLVPCVHGENLDGPALIRRVEEAVDHSSWAVFMFHGVGGEYLRVGTSAHEALLEYLASHETEVWTRPFGDVISSA